MEPPSSQGCPSPGPLYSLTGMYRRSDTAEPINVSPMGTDLRVEGGPRLTRRSGSRFASASGQTYDFTADGLRVTDQFGTVDVYQRVHQDERAARPLADYAGTYNSDEAETTMTAAVDGDALILKRRPTRSSG